MSVFTFSVWNYLPLSSTLLLIVSSLFLNEKVKTDITGVKSTLDKYHKARDETVKAMKE
jgi:hypothetical protein